MKLRQAGGFVVLLRQAINDHEALLHLKKVRYAPLTLKEDF